jgi:hypothetical protein
MIRALALIGGLAGGAALSQYPEFSQQYLQRLAGQVDALNIVVADFENSAMRAGLTRSQALDELTGTPFLQDRQADMRRTFRRHAVLTDNLATLRSASPLARMTMPQRLGDPATFAATWSDFTPAVPLSVAGLAATGAGFVLSWAALRIALALVMGSLRGRSPGPKRGGPALRQEPALHPHQTTRATPRLSGVRRG